MLKLAMYNYVFIDTIIFYHMNITVEEYLYIWIYKYIQHANNEN